MKQSLEEVYIIEYYVKLFESTVMCRCVGMIDDSKWVHWLIRNIFLSTLWLNRQAIYIWVYRLAIFLTLFFFSSSLRLSFVITVQWWEQQRFAIRLLRLFSFFSSARSVERRRERKRKHPIGWLRAVKECFPKPSRSFDLLVHGHYSLFLSFALLFTSRFSVSLVWRHAWFFASILPCPVSNPI